MTAEPSYPAKKRQTTGSVPRPRRGLASVKSERAATGDRRSVVRWTGGQEWERHVIVGWLAARFPDFGPSPLDASLIDLRRISAVFLLGLEQRPLRRLDQLLAFHTTQPTICRGPSVRRRAGI